MDNHLLSESQAKLNIMFIKQPSKYIAETWFMVIGDAVEIRVCFAAKLFLEKHVSSFSIVFFGLILGRESSREKNFLSL